MSVLVIKDPRTAEYGFGAEHPFGPDRHDAFHAELARSGVADTIRFGAGEPATDEELASFHTREYLDQVAARCAAGEGFLDAGDTPARPGIDASARAVVGAALFAMEEILAARVRRAFVPIAGLHHAGRAHASGFCVFNDCGVVIELLRKRHGLRRVAYVDIDAHHGDGVFYAFESDPDLGFADIHEDGRFLYPGTGFPDETGRDAAVGTKLNLPLQPGAGDAEFSEAWQQVEDYLVGFRPEFILMQCGADSVAGDPITHLNLSPQTHGRAAARLGSLADRFCDGRLLATGGGGYNRRNLALAWTAVVHSLV